MDDRLGRAPLVDAREGIEDLAEVGEVDAHGRSGGRARVGHPVQGDHVVVEGLEAMPWVQNGNARVAFRAKSVLPVNGSTPK